MSEIHFVGKSRYEDLSETGSFKSLKALKLRPVIGCYGWQGQTRKKTWKLRLTLWIFKNTIPAKITIKATLMKFVWLIISSFYITAFQQLSFRMPLLCLEHPGNKRKKWDSIPNQPWKWHNAQPIRSFPSPLRPLYATKRPGRERKYQKTSQDPKW